MEKAMSAATDSRGVDVLHVTGEYPPYTSGGLGRVVHGLSETQAAEGLDVHVLLLRGSGTAGRRDSAPSSGEGTAQPAVTVVDIDPAEFEARSAGRIRSGSLSGQVPSLPIEPDLVHSHDWYGTLAAIELLDRFDPAVVASAHLPLRVGFTYTGHGVDKRVKMRLESVGLRLADLIITPSRSTKRIVSREYDVAPETVRVVPNGVDTDAFRPTCVGDVSAPPLVFAVGRMTEQKGFQYLLDAVPTIADAVPEVRIRIAGDGPRLSALRRRAAEAGYGEYVEFPGYVSERRLRREYRRAEVVAFPSVFETFGLVGLEAAASGTPAVGFDVGGVRTVIDDGVTGVLVEPYRSDQLADRIVDLLSDSERRLRLGRAARDHADSFAWPTVAAEVRRAYETAMEQAY
jgi:glycosyltransferase involved in cell wall biosynthesis